MLSHNYPARLSLIQLMIDKGMAYRAFKEFIIPANGEFLFAVTINENIAVLYDRIIVTDKTDIRYEVRSGAVIGTESNPMLVKRQNPFFGSDSSNTIKECTASDLGTIDDIDIIPGQAGSGSNRRGQVYNPQDIKIIPNQSKILVRMVNPNNEPCSTLLYYKWFEVGENAWG